MISKSFTSNYYICTKQIPVPYTVMKLHFTGINKVKDAK